MYLYNACPLHTRPLRSLRRADVQKVVEGDSGNLIIIIVVFCLILAAMVAAFLFNCIRKLVRDQKIIRVSSRGAHMRYNERPHACARA